MDTDSVPTVASEQQQQTWEFFALPPELRNRIYELLLRVERSDGKVSIVKLSSSHFHNHARQRGLSVLSLLLVCRQVNEEARGVFYNLNHLRFTENPTGSDCLRGFLSSVSEERLKAVNAMTLMLPESLEAVGLFWMINRLCPRLRILHVMPAYVSASVVFDKHLTSMLLEFQYLVDFKVIDPPWGRACGTRVFQLRSLEELVQRKSRREQQYRGDTVYDDIPLSGKGKGKLSNENPVEWTEPLVTTSTSYTHNARGNGTSSFFTRSTFRATT